MPYAEKNALIQIIYAQRSVCTFIYILHQILYIFTLMHVMIWTIFALLESGPAFELLSEKMWLLRFTWLRIDYF